MLTDCYIAGFFDGEGSVKIYNHKDKRGFTYPELRISITNCDKIILSKIQTHFGCGKIRETGNHNKGHNHCFRLIFERKKDMLVILNQLLPFIIIKREECIKAINFLKGEI